jgi:hypothetical protein
MEKFFKRELLAANIVMSLRSLFALIVIFAIFAAYITASSGLFAQKMFLAVNKDIFEVLVNFKLIKLTTVPIIALFAGFLIALVTELSGFIFALRGKHVWGVFFSCASSLASFYKIYIALPRVNDSLTDSALADAFGSGFLTFAPVLIVYLIANECSKNAEKGIDPVKIFSENTEKMLEKGFSDYFEKAKKTIKTLISE